MTDQTPPKPDETSSVPAAKPAGYQVLARKYRPTDFNALIGQEALVRTLTNAIETGRLHHAFVLTGVRGIGKTTTARIIARALNCIGPDGKGGPTPDPCGVCANCKAIAEDRHVDVIEMDAASRTGVDDIRELIEGVRYRPVSARFKIYIIDEVHMLTKNAFNALLKTLEEPPDHVKFVFATTEIRKVPVTVLSRCMRFDLRRVDTETLSKHFAGICEKENAQVEETALGMIARAADGSVRDGLSLLDQAISHATGAVDEAQVRTMLGLADRSRTFDLFDAVMKGDVKQALDIMAEQYRSGADPTQVAEDLLDLTHWLTRVKIAPEVAEAAGVAEMERSRGQSMAEGLGMAALTRAWQMLLKGLGEVQMAPSAEQALEMVLIRLSYAANLPSPADLARQVQGSGSAASPTASPTGGGVSTGGTSGHQANAVSPGNGSGQATSGQQTGPVAMHGSQPAQAERAPEPALYPDEEQPLPDPQTFDAVIQLATDCREVRLRHDLTANLRLIRFEPGVLEFSPTNHAPKTLAQDLTKFLNAQTDRRWVVSIKGDGGGATIKETRDAEQHALEQRARKTDLVKAVLETFPGAELDVRPAIAALPDNVGAPDEGLGDDEDGYNPIDDAPDLDA